MEDLFSMAAQGGSVEPEPVRRNAPLADRMRPRTLDEFLGQRQIVGPGRLLRRAIEADRLTSCIFYGPPGTGKTTLASIIARIITVEWGNIWCFRVIFPIICIAVNHAVCRITKKGIFFKVCLIGISCGCQICPRRH